MALREALEVIVSVALPSSTRKTLACRTLELAFGVVQSSCERSDVGLLEKRQNMIEVVAQGSGGPVPQARRCHGHGTKQLECRLRASIRSRNEVADPHLYRVRGARAEDPAPEGGPPTLGIT